MCNLLPHLYFSAQLETYFSPKAFLQNSAASALVIRNVSPWKRPLGKIPLSSASMWLNIRDNLVRFLLQRTTEIVSFRKKKSLAFWAKQNQLLLQFKNDPSMHNSFGALFEVFPQHSEHPKHGNYQQGVCQDIFHKLCIISITWTAKNPPMGEHNHRKRAKPVLRPHLLSIEHKTSSALGLKIPSEST